MSVCVHVSFLLDIYIGWDHSDILRNYCIVFHRGCTIVLPSSVYKGSNFSMSLKVFAIFCFLFIAILLCVKWYFSIVLICISLMANDVE